MSNKEATEVYREATVDTGVIRRTIQVELRDGGFISISQVVTSSVDCTSVLNTVQMTGDEFEAIRESLIGKAIGLTTKEVIKFRSESQQMYATLKKNAKLLFAIAKDEEIPIGILNGLFIDGQMEEAAKRIVMLMRLLATCAAIQVADRFDVSEETDKIRDGTITTEKLVEQFLYGDFPEE